MDYHCGFDKLCEALKGSGALLVVLDDKKRLNVMTIGWAQTGVIWGRPVMTVLVRPSRYTHELLENARYFAVCVPAAGAWKKELAFCGSKSGREHDKLRACAFKTRDGSKPGVKLIEGAALSYECEILSRAEMPSSALPREIRKQYYPAGDSHTLYFGEIIKIRKA
ncbi:MAG: flavin reductase [Elusimicrobia bacterium]|nr:flavin reductase [Elusimicrobiota bacterium]